MEMKEVRKREKHPKETKDSRIEEQRGERMKTMKIKERSVGNDVAELERGGARKMWTTLQV